MSAIVALIVQLTLTMLVMPFLTEKVAAQPAEVIWENCAFEVESFGSAHWVVRCTLEVREQRGLEHARLVLPDSRLYKLKKFTASVLLPDESIFATYSIADGHRQCGFSEYALYADVCYLTYEFAAPRYPFRVVYEYRVQNKSLLFWPDWDPVRTIPVRHSSYKVSAPKEFSYIYRVSGTLAAPTEIAESGRLIRTWTLDRIAEHQAEPFAPVSDTIEPRVRFQAVAFSLAEYRFDASSWASLGRGNYELFRSQMDLTPDQREWAIRFASENPVEAIKLIDRELRRKLRYVAVSIGVGGWRPHSARECLEQGYGDCKDMVTTYLAVFGEIGVRALPALVKTRGNRDQTEPEFPAMDFNHVIVMIPFESDTLWLDPTCADCAFGDLPWSDEGVYALVLDPTTSALIRTPISTPAENVLSRSMILTANSDGSLDLDASILLRGNAAHGVSAIISQSPRGVDCRDLEPGLFGFSAAVSCQSVEVISCCDLSPTTSVRMRGKLPGAILSTGQQHYVPLSFASLLSARERALVSGRKEAVELTFPLYVRDSIILIVPAAWTCDSPHDSLSQSDSFGALGVLRQATGDTVIVQRHASRNVHEIALPELTEYEAHRRSVLDASNMMVVFRERTSR